MPVTVGRCRLCESYPISEALHDALAPDTFLKVANNEMQTAKRHRTSFRRALVLIANPVFINPGRYKIRY